MAAAIRSIARPTAAVGRISAVASYHYHHLPFLFGSVRKLTTNSTSQVQHQSDKKVMDAASAGKVHHYYISAKAR
jgi:hypothetical protein